VVHRRRHAVHELGRVVDGRAERLADRLMAETDTEKWDAAPRRRPHHGDRRAGVGGSAWAGGDQHPAIWGDQLGRVADGIGFDEVGRGTQLVQVPDERVHEAVVVVDDEDRRRAHRRPVTRP
jgi:hypothetical protein